MKKTVHFLLTAALCLCLLPTEVYARQLIPVGQVVGLELRNATVSVAAFDSVLGQKAQAAGLQIGDEIIDIDGMAIDEAADVITALERSDGSIDVTVLRKQKQRQLCLTPEITVNGPRLGVYLRQGITGIGTVTYYDAETGKFGALGHGINDSHGELAEMTRGQAYCAEVMSVKRGKCGQPGQLCGGIESKQTLGTLYKNSQQGIFGTTESGWDGKPLDIAEASEITTGPATIYSTVSGDEVREYSVEILKIYPKSRSEGRNMLLRVTDPALLSATGGIVQGMSGSPLVQDGKLIGAVTHVLVNDPTMGYGIFIENMLEAAG